MTKNNKVYKETGQSGQFKEEKVNRNCPFARTAIDLLDKDYKISRPEDAQRTTERLGKSENCV